MTSLEKTISLNLSPVLPLLSDFNLGKLIGIGEGLAMALENAPAPAAPQPDPVSQEALERAGDGPA